MMRWTEPLKTRILAALPERFRPGKMPYAFFFALIICVVLLTYAVISPYPHSSVIFTTFAVFLLALLWMVYRGLAIHVAIHLGTAMGAFILF